MVHEYHPATTGNEALELIRRYRSHMADVPSIEPLAHEFPYLTHELGLQGVTLFDLSANRAGTFKWRGALAGADHLRRQGTPGLIAPSAGNHARGAILAGELFGLPTTVIVPTTAPELKQQGLRGLWDSTLLRVYARGRHFDDTLPYVDSFSGDLLHPYDDPSVIAGQGTIVDDLLQLKPSVEHIVLPVGGAGLTAGVVSRLTELGKGTVKVHAMQAAGSDSLSRSLATGHVVEATAPNKRYGGSAVTHVGTYALDLCRRAENLTVYTVPDQAVFGVAELYEQGRQDLLRQNTPNFEPTTLVAVAGLGQLAAEYTNVVVLGTGQNAPISDIV